MLLPHEIAKYLTPGEYESLNEKVYSEFKQGFKIITVQKMKKGKVVIVQLDDRTRKEITL